MRRAGTILLKPGSCTAMAGELAPRAGKGGKGEATIKKGNGGNVSLKSQAKRKKICQREGTAKKKRGTEHFCQREGGLQGFKKRGTEKPPVLAWTSEGD